MEQKPYKCFLACRAEFPNPNDLKQHVHSFHLKLKRFECLICFKRFVNRQGLLDHAFVHVHERSYICSAAGCIRGFRRESMLVMHMKKHQLSELTGHSLKLPSVNAERRYLQQRIRLPMFTRP